MNAGRDLDALIHSKVMGQSIDLIIIKGVGLENFSLEPGSVNYVEDVARLADIPYYSTDISAAWDVFEKLKHLHPHINYNDTETQYRVEFVNRDKETVAYADTAPHAICLAALKAVGHD